MKPELCPMATLVEARADGRLGDREVASIERHLAACASCTALVEDLALLDAAARAPSVSLSPLERQRARVKLLRRAALLEPRGTARRAPWFLAVACGVVAIAGVLWAHERLPAAPRLAASTPAPALLGPASPGSAKVERVVTTIEPQGAAQFSRSASEGMEIVSLDDGAVRFSVRHLAPGERFLVKTRDAEVEVRGTVFRVEAAAGKIRAVSVTEGRVEVRFEGASVILDEGNTWSPPAEHAAVDVAPSSTVAQTPVTPRSAADTEPSRVGVTPPPGDKGPPVRVAASSPPAPAPTMTKAEEAAVFAEGVRMFERGDYGAAAGRLSGFSAAHPGDDRAEDAEFLAVLALQRSGRSAAARAAAQRYLARHPTGYHRGEAQAIVAGR